jgi:hypothetical protein
VGQVDNINVCSIRDDVSQVDHINVCSNRDDVCQVDKLEFEPQSQSKH